MMIRIILSYSGRIAKTATDSEECYFQNKIVSFLHIVMFCGDAVVSVKGFFFLLFFNVRGCPCKDGVM